MRRETVWGAAAGGAVLVLAGVGLIIALGGAGDEKDPSRVELVNATTASSASSTVPSTQVVVTLAPTTAATTTMPTTTTTTTLAAAITTTIPTTLPAPPARLEVAAAELDLGLDGVEGTIVIGNSGGQPLDWSTSSDNALVQATPGGSLGPGAQTTVTVAVSRSGLIEGDYTGVVSVLGAGRGVPVTVRWRVERNPVVRVSLNPPGLADADTCPDGTPELTGVVTASLIDESAIAGAVMAWEGPDPSEGGAVALGQAEPGSWTGTLGPLLGAGSWTVTVTATDARGNAGSGTTTLVVTACAP